MSNQPYSSPSRQENTFQSLISIINQCLSCKHNEYYMQQKNVASLDAPYIYRFYFRRPRHNCQILTRSFNPKSWIFDTESKDLNNYSRLITMAWVANTGVTPCTVSQAVLNYIAKYCTKM